MYQSSNSKPLPFPLDEQQPQTYNWNIDNMPWKRNMNERNQSSVVQFNGIPSTSGINLTRPPTTSMKRKSDIDDDTYFPNKQLITEEKMALYLNGIHLSDNFQAHDINLNDNTFEEEMDMSYHVNLSPEELERRLRNAQRITVCEDVKKSFHNADEIIPKILLDRIEKPSGQSQALILWKPQQSMTLQQLLKTNFNESKSKKMDEDQNEMKNDDENMCE